MERYTRNRMNMKEAANFVKEDRYASQRMWYLNAKIDRAFLN